MNPYNAYAAATTMTDEHDKGKVLLVVLEALTRKIEEVKVSIAQKKYEKKYAELTRIVQTLQLLDASLDMSLGEIPKNLSFLYGYVSRKLQAVHASLEIEALDECKSILAAILEGFTEAYQTEKRRTRRAPDVRGCAPVRMV